MQDTPTVLSVPGQDGRVTWKQGAAPSQRKLKAERKSESWRQKGQSPSFSCYVGFLKAISRFLIFEAFTWLIHQESWNGGR